MMLVETTLPRRRWSVYRRRRLVFKVPECWADLGDDREKWYRRINRLDAAQAQVMLLRKIIPRRWRWRMKSEDLAAILANLRWLEIKSDCSDPAIVQYKHKGVLYHLPKPDGGNMVCAEFAVCDDLYKTFLDNGTQQALERLTTILYREAESEDAAAARGDIRVKFNTQDEADLRIRRMGKVPRVMQQQALLYFSGLKAWVYRVYGPWIFEEPPEADENEPLPQPASDGPNFGWWGILQAVAESGTFGTLEQVYQTSLHEVCIFLVRKKQEADRLASMTTKPTANNDDLH